MSSKVFEVAYAIVQGGLAGNADSKVVVGSDVENAISNLRTNLALPDGQSAIIYEATIKMAVDVP